MLPSFFIESKMEYKKNKKKFSLAFKKEVALKAVFRRLFLDCLGISSTCMFIDYSAHLLEFVLFV